MGSRLTIKTNPPIIIRTDSDIEIADSQTFFADGLIITVPEAVEVDLEHGQAATSN